MGNLFGLTGFLDGLLDSGPELKLVRVKDCSIRRE
jgi:hypothetical protein